MAPPPLRPHWEAGPRARVLLPALTSIWNRADAGRPWVWKDPQTCLTLPLWRRVWNALPCLVLVRRPVSAIVDSLIQRDGLDSAHSLAIWERYLRSALFAIADSPFIVLDYELLLSSPQSAVERLAADLQTMGVRVDKAGAEGRVQSALRHNIAHEHVKMSREQSHLEAFLQSLSGLQGGIAPADLGPETSDLDLLFRHRRAADLARFWKSARPFLTGHKHPSKSTS